MVALPATPQRGPLVVVLEQGKYEGRAVQKK